MNYLFKYKKMFYVYSLPPPPSFFLSPLLLQIVLFVVNPYFN